MCLAGAVITSWSIIQEVAGSNPFTVMTNIFVTEFAEHLGKTQLFAKCCRKLNENFKN